MNPQEVLRQLGLEDKEIAIYMGLLESGESTVLTISRKTSVKRPTAYLILAELEKRGLVTRLTKRGKIMFAAANPRKITADAEFRLSQLKDAVPQLEALMQRGDDRPRVIVYEGSDAVDKAYDDWFVTKGEICFMSNTELVHDVFRRTMQKVEYSTFTAEFSAREIVDDSEISRKYAARANGPHRQIRFFPKAFSPFATDIGIFGNNTIITSGKKEVFSVRIESKEIADAFRSLYDAMWKLSGEATAA